MLIKNNIRANRELYEAPDTWELDVENEDIICTSYEDGPEGSREDYDDPIEREY